MKMSILVDRISVLVIVRTVQLAISFRFLSCGERIRFRRLIENTRQKKNFKLP